MQNNPTEPRTTRRGGKINRETEPGNSALNLEGVDGESACSQIPDQLHEHRFQYPVADVLICEICRGRGVNEIFLNSSLLEKHLQTAHPHLKSVWECSICRKTYPRKLGVAVHYAKCKCKTAETADPLEEEDPPSTQFSCVECTEKFATKSGLSQHERHRHPVLRNQARRANVVREEPDKIPKQRNLKIWTEDEEALLAELEIRFAGERCINKLIAEHFPGKDNKQVSDKRRDIRLKSSRVKKGASASSSTRPNAPSELSPHPHPSRVETNKTDLNEIYRPEACVNIDSKAEESGWRKSLAASAVRTFHKHKAKLRGERLAIGVRLEAIAQAIREGDPDSRAANIQALEAEITALTAKCAPAKAGARKIARQNRSKGKNNRDVRRKRNYALAQNLFKRKPKQLAQLVIEDKLDEEDKAPPSPPRSDEVAPLYSKLWETKSETAFPSSWGRTQETLSGVVAIPPIQLLAVRTRHRKLKSHTASGLDNVGKGDISSETLILLTIIFNLLLALDHFPHAWMKNRTTLIPKVGKDPSEAANWRPITVGAIFSRLFMGVLNDSLGQNIRFSWRQKGFVSEAGTTNNVVLLQQVMRAMKGTGGVCSILDISKAFDTVPHGAIVTALTRVGVPAYIACYIANSYEGCTTDIKCEEGVVRCGLQRGVKQGDPLSPLIFNAVVDPLLCYLDQRDQGIAISGMKVSCIAFADDLVLTSETKAQAEADMKISADFFASLGMSISIPKCCTFEYRAGKKTWTVQDPELKVNEQVVKYTGPEEAFRYLGIDNTPWSGSISGRLACQELIKCLERVTTLPLKPLQKQVLMFRYIYPRYYYMLTHDPPSKTALRDLDCEVRRIVKKIYHLPSSIASGLIYSRTRDGGLGIPKIENDVLISVIRREVAMRNSQDPLLQVVAETTNVKTEAAKAAQGLNIPVIPQNLKGLAKAKAQLKDEIHRRWMDCGSQGQGANYYRDSPISHAWMSRDDLLAPNRMIDALRMRTNTIGTRATLIRSGYHHLNVTCRKCKNIERPETLSHVLGGCVAQKGCVIRRHDEIGGIIETEFARRCPESTLIREPTLQNASGERLKPDLVIKHENWVFVVDYTVRYENKDLLEEAALEKKRKYECLETQLLELLGGTRFEVIPIVIGARGIIPRDTLRSLKRLNISDRKTLLTIAMTALRCSLEMANDFLDS